MRKQYHFRPSKNGNYAWDVDRLVLLTRNLEKKEVSVDTIREVDENYWFGGKDDVPTCRAIVEHMKLVHEADLSYPIILSADGGVMDGMHRVAKALFEGKKKITAVQFEETPKADYEDVHPDELPYD